MKHLKENGENYLSHLLFSGKVGLTLLFRGVVFLLHGLIPICSIPKKWNLEETSLKLFRWSEYTNRRKK
tara:strand:+ start:2802 stop:3008 length:207 start_codon:yes stop_codon:yes gene_type:complete